MAKTNWQSASWIKQITRPDWELFFDACNEVIDHFDVDADSPLLAMNIHQNSSDGILMNISNRATIDMHLGEGTQVMLMLPLGATKRVLNEEEIIETFGFSRPATADGTRVTMDTFRNKMSLLLPEVEEATKQLLARSKSSPFRKHHIPDLYRMATEADFREKALNFMLEGKGEWPGSAQADATSYWIFQANPTWYDAVGALRDRAVDRWSVAAHKQSIKPGDKAIIWVTGPSSGCYALVTVASMVSELPLESPAYTRKGEFNSIHDRVLITIDHNLWDRPILESSIAEAQLGLKAGNQGTTFSATKEQYQYLLTLATKPAHTMHDLNTILYGPPGTGKTYQLLQLLTKPDSADHEQEATTVLNPQANFWHLAPGGGGHLWDSLRKGIRLGYEWADKSYGDLSKVKRETIGNNFNIITRLAQVRKGDYLCVISGKRLLGLAQALYGYSYERSMAGSFDFQTVEVEWIRKFDPPLLLSKSSTPAFTKIGSARWGDMEKALAQEGISIGSETKLPIKARPEHMFLTLHQSFSYEDFIEGIKPELDEVLEEDSSQGLGYVIRDGLFKQACNEAVRLAGYTDLNACLEDDRSSRAKKLSAAPCYKLVIDEINRGNIAAVFGELITLIEPDKRAGAEYEVTITLPYSQTSFAVPLNLQIIGTMNTADRSVEALDTALRRRFSFVKMPSKPELIKQPKGFVVQIQPLLTAINDRIERLLDKDHHIGHSYFMGIDLSDDPEHALRLVFKNKVLPLLEEYFYGDPRKLGAVLGPQWVKKREGPQHKLFGKFDIDDAAKDVFDVTDPMEAGLDDYASIYA